MRRIAVYVCVVVSVLAVAVQAQTQAQPISESVEQELRKLENGWMEAFLKSDIAFLDQILADDITNTDSEGNVFTKAQVLAVIKSGAYLSTSAVKDDIKVRVYGDAAKARPTEESGEGKNAPLRAAQGLQGIEPEPEEEA